MKCQHCGNEIPNDSRFCQSCGQPVQFQPPTPPLEKPLANTQPNVNNEAAPVTGSQPSPTPVFEEPQMINTPPQSVAPDSTNAAWNQVPPSNPDNSQIQSPVQSGKKWYKKWWIWLIIGLGTLTLLFISTCTCTICVARNKTDSLLREYESAVKDISNYTETKKPTEKATEKPTEKATEAPTTVSSEDTINNAIDEGYEKVSDRVLYNHAEDYLNKKILTAVKVNNTLSDTLYADLEEDDKLLSYFNFEFDSKDELKDIEDDDYAVIYGTVKKKGSITGTVEVEKCHIAAKGSEAEKYYQQLKDEAPKEVSTQKPAESESKKESSYSKSSDEKVLYDANGVKVTYKGMEKGWMSTKFKVKIENNSGKDLMVQTRDESINGLMVSVFFSCDVKDGKSANDEIDIMKSELEDNDIESIDDFEFYFTFIDSDDWLDTFESDIITIKP